GGDGGAAGGGARRRSRVQSARRKGRGKRGGGRRRVDLGEYEVTADPLPQEILALDEALPRLAAADPEAAQVVRLRFFAGLSIEQAAGALGISRATPYRQWTLPPARPRFAI